MKKITHEGWIRSTWLGWLGIVRLSCYYRSPKWGFKPDQTSFLCHLAVRSSRIYLVRSLKGSAGKEALSPFACASKFVLVTISHQREGRKVHSKESHFFLNNVRAVYINSSGTPIASWQVSLRNVISAWTTTAQPNANKEKNEFEGPLTIYHRCVTILSKKTQHEADFWAKTWKKQGGTGRVCQGEG